MELLAGVMQTRRPACALVLRKIFFSVAAKTGAFIKDSFVFSSLTIETGQRSVKPENLKPKVSRTADAPRFARTGTPLQQRRALPTVHGAVELAIDGQVRAAVRIVSCELLIDVHTEAGGVAGMHHSVGKGIGMREDAIGFGGVVHVFLDAEIVDAEIEMEGGGHADRAHIGGAVTAGADLVQLGEAGDFSQMGNSAGVHDRGADVVDELLLNELLAIEDGVEDFADSERRGGVAANQAKTFLQLGGSGIFEPEKMVRLELFAEAGGFDGGEAVMRVMEQVKVGAEFLAQALEQTRDKIEVKLRAPQIFDGRVFFCGLVIHFAAADAVGACEAGDAALRANGFVAELGVGGYGDDGVPDVVAAGVAVDEDGVAGGAAEQLVDGNVEGFALDVPERGVHRRDGGHGYRAAAPVRALVKVLPEVFDAARVAADEKRNDMIGEITGDGEFAAVEGGVDEAVDA